jgi:hypothetical protein
MDDTRALAALDVVLNMGINDSVGRLGRAEATLVEAREMCPVLFATVGQVFEHPLKLGDDRAVFRYKGRTTRGGSATCSEETCGSSNCGEGPHLTPPNWLIFSSWGTHVKGSGVDESEQVTYNESEPGVCQDVRDLIEAGPSTSTTSTRGRRSTVRLGALCTSHSILLSYAFLRACATASEKSRQIGVPSATSASPRGTRN